MCVSAARNGLGRPLRDLGCGFAPRATSSVAPCSAFLTHLFRQDPAPSAQCPRRTLLRQCAHAAAMSDVSSGAIAAVSEWPPPRVASAPSAVVAGRLRESRPLWRTGASLRRRFVSEGSRPIASRSGGWPPFLVSFPGDTAPAIGRSYLRACTLTNFMSVPAFAGWLRGLASRRFRLETGRFIAKNWGGRATHGAVAEMRRSGGR